MKSVILLSALALAAVTVHAQVPGPGEVQLQLPGGGLYIGTVSNGVPDGKGYFRDADGMQYEGEVRMGKRTGIGEGLFKNGDRYQGEWKNGKPDGQGSMRYMLGGAFEGRWREGVPDGRGTMTFAGSGRRAAVGFLDGERLDAPPPPQQGGAAPTYALRDATAPLGSHMARRISTSALPMNAGWDQLTPAQQHMVRDYYPALDNTDEPPYPEKGAQALYARLAELAGKYDLDDEVRLYVLVGTDGKAVSVTSFGITDPEARRLAGVLAGLVKYKPARCAGQPCQMVFPYRLRLSVEH